MKVEYDAKVDVLRIRLQDGPVEESDEPSPGVILDFDAKGTLLVDEADFEEELPALFRGLPQTLLESDAALFSQPFLCRIECHG